VGSGYRSFRDGSAPKRRATPRAKAARQRDGEATKAAQRAGIEHAKQNDGRAYLGRKPSFTREQFNEVREMLGQQAVGIAQIATETVATDRLPD
jgi:hypothetical protein